MNAKNLIKFLFSYTALFVLLTIFVFLIIYTLTTMSKVFSIVVEYIRFSVFEEALTSGTSLTALIIKLISIFISFYLLFVLYAIISGISTYKSYEVAAQKYSFKEPDLEEVFFKAISWNIYRVINILSPLLSICAVIGLLLFLNMFFFNTDLSIAGFSIALATFLTSFISIMLAVGFIFAIGLTVWNIFITLFGIECAVSEPELENNVIRKRSRKLSLAKKSNIKMYVLYIIFLSTLLVQFVGLLLFPDILNEENIFILAAMAIIDIILFIGLGYLKSTLYIDSLMHQYERITFKDKYYLKELISE